MNYIGKSYLQLTEQEKEYFIKLYYDNLDLTVKEIGNKLGLSKRCTNLIFKEYSINSKRKNRYTLNEYYFERIDTQEKSYILGLIYSDGYVGDEKSNNISITQKEYQLLYEIKKEIEFTGDIRVGNKGGFENSKLGYVLNFSSKKMSSDLRKLGLYPNKSLTLEEIPDLRSNLKRHFFRGYFDGDGSISNYIHTFKKNNKNYSYRKGKMSLIATEKMLYNFVKTFNIEQYHISKSKTEQMKYLQIEAKKELVKIYELMYKDCSICNKTKKEKWDILMSAIM